MAGRLGMLAVTPNFLAISTTAGAPTSLINRAETVLIEFAKAFFIDTNPLNFPSELFGVQSLSLLSPLGIVNGASKIISHGDFPNRSIQVAYTKGLKVEPT